MAKRKKNQQAKANPTPKGPPPQHIRQRMGLPSIPGNPPPARSHGYTLAEEAKHTASNRRGVRGRDARLRHQPVVFISAGLMDPLKLLEPSEQTDESIPLDVAQCDPDVAVPNPAASPTRIADVGGTAQQDATEAPDDPIPSDIGSDSDDEVILFKGRNAAPLQQKSPLPEPPLVVDDTLKATETIETNLELRVVEEVTNITIDTDPISVADNDDFISLNVNKPKPRPSRKPPRHSNPDEDDEEAAIIADYIANMRDFDDGDDDNEDGNQSEDEHPGLASHAFSILRDLGGTDSDAIPSQPSSEDELEEGSDAEGVDDVDAKRRLESEDERLAQLIAKQEELGLDCDDIMLLDGDYDDGDGWKAVTSVPRRRGNRKQKKGGSNKARMFEGGSQFPNATRMAEAFDELDLMDMQKSRTMMQRAKKGPVSFGLSDSELEDALNVAIKKDRLKKADKKRAREELRSQGLLGKNGGAGASDHDLRAKYLGGMSLDDLADEFETFMLSTREQLILPPFDKSARKIVHTIANAFNIKSKSAGSGTGRYPVLYRVKRTLPYDEVLFDRTFSRIKCTWFPRVDADEKVVQETRVLKRTEVRVGGKSRTKSNMILREGDVVGQHASELGIENKGRAMLEKMGWSKGMSLGTLETQGIVVPITHVIKKSKAGLGDV